MHYSPKILRMLERIVKRIEKKASKARLRVKPVPKQPIEKPLEKPRYHTTYRRRVIKQMKEAAASTSSTSMPKFNVPVPKSVRKKSPVFDITDREGIKIDVPGYGSARKSAKKSTGTSTSDRKTILKELKAKSKSLSSSRKRQVTNTMKKAKKKILKDKYPSKVIDARFALERGKK